MKVIAIDLGATSGRVMTVSHENHQFSYVENARFSNKVYQDKNTLRWDFSYLMENIITGIKKALMENPDIASIGIDTWGVDYGFIKDGKLLNDPICYRDTRTFQSQKELLEKKPFKDIYQKVGIQNLHFNTIYQLASETIDYADVDTFLMIPDLIAYHLTGEARLEETNASTTSLYSQKEGKMDEELLNLIHVPERIFAKIIHPGEEYGKLKKEFLPENINKDIPVIAVCTHDTASAVLGSNGKGNFAYISSGTWSLIGTELDHPIINKESLEANFTNEIGYHSTIRFLKNTMGMFLCNQVREDYQKHHIHIEVKDIVSLVNEANDINTFLNVDDPIFETPGDMLEKVATYCKKTNQQYPQTPGEMLKVIYKSMALTYKGIIAKLESLAKTKIKSILVVGGGNQASILNQYTASACGIDVITGPSEATVLGNSIAQLLSLHDIASVDSAREDITRSIQTKIYHPQETDNWDSQYNQFILCCLPKEE